MNLNYKLGVDYLSLKVYDNLNCYDKSRIYIQQEQNENENESFKAQNTNNNIQENINQENQIIKNSQIMNSTLNQSTSLNQSQLQNIYESNIEETRCQICLNDIANNPIMCMECHKIFGLQCVSKIKRTNNQNIKCPVCKCEWIQKIEKMINRFARDMISKTFQLKCIYNEYGCNTVLSCQQNLVIDHEKNCKFQKVSCCNKGIECGWQGILLDLEKHKQDCPYKIEFCQNCKQFGYQFEFFKQDQHNLICPNEPVECKFCKLIFPKKQIQFHIDELCEKRIFSCKVCQKQFNRIQYLKHEQENCYEKGNEKQMFEKLLIQINKNNKKQEEWIRNQKIMFFKQNYTQKLMIMLESSKNKLKILEDFENNIIHIYSLEQFYEIYQSGMQIKSVIINETDLKRFIYSRSSKHDFTQIINFLKKLAQSGDSWSQFSLGLLYYCGDKDIEPSEELAFQWAKKSSDQNNPAGQCLLALHYLFGYCVPKNFDLAYQYLSLSIKQQFPPSYYYLGDCYMNAKGQPTEDIIKGLECYIFSAEMGYPYALKYIGEKYDQEMIQVPPGQNKDHLVFQYYEKAAKKGVLAAINQVIDCYKIGKGIEKNQFQAQAWQKILQQYKQIEEINSNNNNDDDHQNQNEINENIQGENQILQQSTFILQDMEQQLQLYNQLYQSVYQINNQQNQNQNIQNQNSLYFYGNQLQENQNQQFSDSSDISQNNNLNDDV